MYRRKIGKKIFRRTRKHKFYGIKVKKGPSMLTRRRVRRGGEGETVIIQGIQETDSSISLDEDSCNAFAVRANELANAADDEGNEYRFSEQALKDIEECVPFLENINIADLIKENVDSIKANRRIKYENEQYKNQREAERLAEEIAETQANRAIQAKKTAESLKKIRSFNFFRELIGDGLNDDAVVSKLDKLLAKYLVFIEHSKKIYQIIFSILIECIKFNDKNGVFIEKISIDTGDDDNVEIYTIIIKLLYSLAKRDTDAPNSIPDFLKYYNSFFENTPEKLGYTLQENKPILPSYINVNKVLRILYGYYDIIISTLAQYYVVLNIYSVQFEHISKINITNMANDKFSPNLISVAPEASTPPEETTDTATLKISNDVLLKFLLTDFTLNTTGLPKIPVNKKILVGAFQTLLTKTVSFFRTNEDLTLKSENLEKVFLLDQPPDAPDGQLNILKGSDNIDDNLLTRFKNITWVKNFLLLYDDIFCFDIKTISITSGLKTKTNVRKQIEEKIIVPRYQDIQEKIENGEIFKTPQVSDFIVKILKENSEGNQACAAGFAFKEFIKYTKGTPSNSSYYLGIFCNMVIYACYMSTSEDSSGKSIKEGKAREDEWGEKGTDLMRIYMNNFIIEYVKNELKNLRTIIDLFLNFLYTQYQRPPNTYIFCGLGIVSYLGACRNAKIILEQIKKKFSAIYEKKVIDILRTYKKKYDDNNTLINQNNLTAIDELERLLSVVMKTLKDDNDALLTEKDLNIVLCVGNNKDCDVLKETTESLKGSQNDSREKKQILLMKILSMNHNNLHKKVYDVCEEILQKLIESMNVSESEKEALNQNSQDVKNFLRIEQAEYPTNTTDEQRKKCEMKLAFIISEARKHKVGDSPINLSQQDLIEINICANPNNIFDHQKQNENEYNKRIARAYYGINEILPVCDPITRDNIEKLPNFIQLKNIVTHDQKIREDMLKQCKDDHKGVLGFYNQTRELIKAGLSSDEINKKCDEDFGYVDTSSDTRRKDCEIEVAKIINKARKHNGEKGLELERQELNMINICANPVNVFEHQKINPKEFYKRIARAYYGIMEILVVCGVNTEVNINELPNFIKLKKMVQDVNNTDLRNMIHKHCKDDHKGVLGFHNKTRELIKAGLSSEQINNKCDNLKTHFDVLNKSFLEFQKDLKEAADKALKNPKLTLTQAQKDKIKNNNRLKTAMAYVNILNNKELYKTNTQLLERANKFLKDHISTFVKAEALLFFGVKPPVYESTNPLVQKIIDERARLRQIKEAHGNDDSSFFSNIIDSFEGGTTSTRARRKYSRKAKHQPKTKRKNKSKSKSKSRVKSNAKTIKKNKRARRKFYKKYTRKH